MKILWRCGQFSAQQVLAEIRDQHISLSTMQSTLERLTRKQLVTRKKSGRYYLYTAALSQSGMIGQLLGEISEQIGDGEMAPMISGFMSFVDQEAPGLLSDQIREVMQQSPDNHD